jgi:hypothetical protein
MHFRNSWTRSMSSCCQRQSSTGVGRRRERRDRLVDLVVPRDVGDEVADQRERPHRLDGDRLGRVEVRQPRLAGQARPAVDLRAAEPHLAALQFQRTARSGRRVGLDPVEGVEDDHPLLDRDLELGERARPPSASPGRSASGCSASVASSGLGQGRQVVGHRGDRRVATSSPRRRAATDDVAPAQLFSVSGSRAGCGRRGSPRGERAARDRLGDLDEVADLEDEVPAGLKARPPAARRSQARSRIDGSAIAPRGRPSSGRSRRATASSPGAPRGAGTDPRPSALERRLELQLGRPDLGGIAVRLVALAAAWAAAPAPARWPKTSRSDSELPPSRFAPCIPPVTSPARTGPGSVVAPVSASTRMPPIT